MLVVVLTQCRLFYAKRIQTPDGNIREQMEGKHSSIKTTTGRPPGGRGAGRVRQPELQQSFYRLPVPSA